MFYATLDADGGYINQDAAIFAFDTRAAAEAYLRSPFDPAEWSISIQRGYFGDCWIKLHAEPTSGNVFIAPFHADDMIIRAPGQHPGGRQWWIEPRVDVLVPMLREVVTDDD